MNNDPSPRLNAPLILVTGGGGWLGKRVVAALTAGLPEAGPLAVGGHRVRVLAPAGEVTSELMAFGVDIVTGDLRDPDAVADFLQDSQGAVLIHLAGIIHPRAVAEFEAINTQGAIGLIAAAKKAGVRRAVVMSSNSPIGCNPRPDHRFDEESPYNPYMGYGRSKMLMEKALRAEMAARTSLEICIVRAPWFYGPGQPPRQTLFFQMIKEGKFPIVGSGENRRSMGYTDNLAQGILLAAAHDAAVGEIFWLADEAPYTMLEVIETVGAVLREDFGMTVKPNRLRLPGVVGDIATLVDASLQSLGVYQQKIHVLSEMNKTIACDISKAKRLLGYRPEVALRDGMRRSTEWCLRNGQVI
ncbi:hypothetical protein CCR94_17530 [Rhodoblastus sphagnicola]|uniref:NAD-dependent epimerase/dehydratase domain-containing protein n=1 Tax=Rhodoblastus sphagnicola TaxID=333368 RepID=A0A2S6N1J7_9HYPH|nr:NAD(P)-dependent oxidoreductase [Rhodoblastus sphagnicola]MBB4200768.1 nucleoside-diphosphate-sugar epimerase [Rhodoblastus sphagnicola]PPQ28497.1 hypothetical protein CCR94_17530 [Rhodoblastus sphagnicola]